MLINIFLAQHRVGMCFTPGPDHRGFETVYCAIARATPFVISHEAIEGRFLHPCPSRFDKLLQCGQAIGLLYFSLLLLVTSVGVLVVEGLPKTGPV